MSLAAAASATAGDVAVLAEGLTKRYKSAEALSGLSLEVPWGEVYGLAGPNGSGKTTALRVLAGLCRPDAGWAEVAGADVVSEAGRLRRLVGYVPDHFGVYESMTAAQYLAFYASCYRIPRRQAEAAVGDLLALVGLTSKRDEQVDHLSRGMKQRLCLARALVHDPQVLLLDEPASGLDPRARGEMRDLVAALGEMGKTVVLASHILPELAEVCSSFGLVHEGRLVASGAGTELLDGELFMSATSPADRDGVQEGNEGEDQEDE
jgi:ABC-2 type transport system ATP-binding protein